jgi:hypothetical protein
MADNSIPLPTVTVSWRHESLISGGYPTHGSLTMGPVVTVSELRDAFVAAAVSMGFSVDVVRREFGILDDEALPLDPAFVPLRDESEGGHVD